MNNSITRLSFTDPLKNGYKKHDSYKPGQSMKYSGTKKGMRYLLFLGFQVLVLVGPKKTMSCVNKMFEVFF